MDRDLSSLEVAKLFVERINSQDLDGLAALMTVDHRFIDSLGTKFSGREAMKEGWRHYFRMVPDYGIEVTDSLCKGEVVVLLGLARGTYTSDGTLDPEMAWQTPAAWRARIIAGQVAEWRVYADNEPIRKCMTRVTDEKRSDD